MLEREQYIPGRPAGADTKGRREVDAHSRRELRHSPENLAGAYRPSASARVGSFRRRWEPGYGWSHGEAHHGWRRRKPHVTETKVTQAAAPEVLEYNWGDHDMRWELEAFGGGTPPDVVDQHRPALYRHGCCRWHICFDVLDRLLIGTPIGRMVGPEAVKFGGWQRLHAEYAKQFVSRRPTGRLRKEDKLIMKEATKRSIFR